MTVHPPAIATTRREASGTWIGLSFCLVAIVNQLFILPQLMPPGDPAAQLLRSVVYWFAFLSAVVHVFLWATYAALATAVARVVFEGDRTPPRFSDAFRCAGWAHGPLLVWALLVAPAWLAWGQTPDPAGRPALFALYAGTRAAAYLLSVVLMAVLLYRRRRDRTFAAALGVAAAPAITVWLGLFLVNGAVGAFVRVS